jgi:hypothetical protein
MNIGLAAEASHIAEGELKDYIEKGVIVRIVAGAGGSGPVSNWKPNIGIHFRDPPEQILEEALRIQAHLTPLIHSSVGINFYFGRTPVVPKIRRN